MSDVDINRSFVDRFLDFSEDEERIASVALTSLCILERCRSRTVRPVRGERRRIRRVAEVALRECNRETLRCDGAHGIELENLVEELGRAVVARLAVSLSLLRVALVLARLDVADDAVCAERVEIVPRDVAECLARKIAREAVLARLEEEVGVEGSQLGRQRLRRERFLELDVRTVPRQFVFALARLQLEKSETGFRCSLHDALGKKEDDRHIE